MRWCMGMPPEAAMALESPKKVDVDYSRLALIGVLLAVAVVGPLAGAAWWFRWNGPIFTAFIGASENYYNAPMILSLFGLTATHELVHLVMHPRCGLSRFSVVGFLPKQFAFYATYTGVQTRRRLLLTLAMPLLVLSVLPYLLAPLLPMVWRSWLAFVSVFNAMGACGDLCLIALVLWRTPHGAYLQGHCYGAAIAAAP